MKIAYMLEGGIPKLLLHKGNHIIYEFVVPTLDKFEKVEKFLQLAIYLDNGGEDLIIKQNEIDEVKGHLTRNYELYETL